MDINYIAEINAFERWLETNHLPSLSQLLWYKLFALFNKSGWAEWITVDNQRLMALIGISREATFIKLRDSLIEAGLFLYKKGKKGCPNRYKFIPFTFTFTFTSEVQTVVNTVVQEVVESEVNSVAQTADITKLNKTKQKPQGASLSAPKAQTVISDDSEAMGLAHYLFDKIRKNNPEARLPNYQKWAKEFDLLLRIDKRSVEKTRYLIDFSQWHSFWKTTILSPDKLRFHYDGLTIKMEEAKKK